MTHKKSERGQNIVLLALMLPILVGMLALGIDGGYGYAQRLRMQTAADAAVMAGARALGLAMTTGEIGSTVSQYASNNGALTSAWSVVGASEGVQVNTSVTWSTFFAGIVGLPTMTAAAQATASLDYLSGADNMLPIAVYDYDFPYDTPITLWDDGAEAPGSLQWLDWDGGGGGGTELADNIMGPGNSGDINIGDLIPPKTGVVGSAQVRDALDWWITSGDSFTVPLYDMVVDVGGNSRWRISGFARFVMTSYDFGGAPKSVTGYFIRYVTPGSGGGTGGIRTIRLSQ